MSLAMPPKPIAVGLIEGNLNLKLERVSSQTKAVPCS